jgi:hypothetical protein
MTIRRTRATSSKTAKSDPVVLRPGERTRLVFIPMFVPSEDNPEAGVRGDFVFQKKALKDAWIDVRSIRLNSLKRGEGYHLDLDSAELLHLHESLKDIYSFRKEKGIPKGDTVWIEAPENAEILSVIQWMATSPQAVDALQRMMALGQLPDLNARLGLASLKATLATWKENQDNSDEGVWQKLLQESTYVLSQVLSFPLVIIRNKPYLGGKGIDNTGGKYSDFLAANALTRSAVIIEIKTPTTPLLSGKYRDDIYPFSEHLSGAIAQALYQRRTFLDNPQLHKIAGKEISPAGICCMVVAGHVGRQLGDAMLKDNFDLQRQSLHGVSVLTYDELFRKIEDLIGLIESPAI